MKMLAQKLHRNKVRLNTVTRSFPVKDYSKFNTIHIYISTHNNSSMISLASQI